MDAPDPIRDQGRLSITAGGLLGVVVVAAAGRSKASGKHVADGQVGDQLQGVVGVEPLGASTIAAILRSPSITPRTPWTGPASTVNNSPVRHAPRKLCW